MHRSAMAGKPMFWNFLKLHTQTQDSYLGVSLRGGT
jgi:hypothetical protein